MQPLGPKFDALCIILGAPLWPQRPLLGETGQALFDAIVGEAKVYALDIAAERFRSALETLGRWAKLLNEFVDATLILDADPSIAEANRRMLAVFKYYCDVTGYDLSRVVRRAAA